MARGTGRGAVGSAVSAALAGLRRVKAIATGRVWDVAHRAESELTRAHEGRRSSFRARAKPKAKKIGGTKKA